MNLANWQLDVMLQNERDKAWEKLNSPTDGESLRQAAKNLRYAIDDLDRSCDCVNEAAENLVDTPEGDKVLSILSTMESILKELKEMQKTWGAV